MASVCCFCSLASADVFVISNATKFPPTIPEPTQGSWSNVFSNHGAKSLYVVGLAVDSTDPSRIGEVRNFFSFPVGIADIPVGHEVVSATLKIMRVYSSDDNEDFEFLEFFDVSTNKDTLNTQTGVSQAIFDDLGSGNSYGVFAVPGHGSTNEILSFELNAMAIADINASINYWFSIGGRLVDPEPNDLLFTFGLGLNPNTLILETQLVPEPSLIGIMVVSCMVSRRRRTPVSTMEAGHSRIAKTRI
jgi:hypothetical protein